MADENSTHLKRCTKCGETKPAHEFPKRAGIADGYKPRCKPCHNADNRAARERNPDVSAQSSKNWAARNKDRVAAKTKRWREENADRTRELIYAWRDRNPEKTREIWAKENKRRAKDPRHRVRKSISEGIRLALNGKKPGKTFDLLGVSFQEFRSHIERQFLPGMTWENFGKWHIDHIVPISAFNIVSADCADFKAAWSIANLRPLWAIDNLRKHAKLTHLI